MAKEEKNEDEGKKKEDEGAENVSVKMPKKRFLKLAIIGAGIVVNLEVESEIMIEEIQQRMPQIRDAILMLLTSNTADDVKSTGGKLKLQDDMVVRINHFLQTGKGKAVYFTGFVMQ